MTLGALIKCPFIRNKVEFNYALFYNLHSSPERIFPLPLIRKKNAKVPTEIISGVLSVHNIYVAVRWLYLQLLSRLG